MSLAAGARLGPYEVTAQIGVGGMGEVYRATDTKLKRDVAIKVLPESVAADPERLARFQREAEVLASLNHPNIAHIHGLEESDGIKALVMELVEGPTLADRIAQGPIPVDEALLIAKQVAEALEAAHEQGIVHRDLKPANIKVRNDGTVKVLDFGLAKAVESTGRTWSPDLSQSPTITSPAMTAAGIILGTATYMSPEQAKGRTVDKRSDVWAFGCVVYEMLTGRRAFVGDDVADTIANVLKSEPDWTALPVLPPLIGSFLRQCFKKDPRQRLPDIAAMRLALEGAFDTPALQASSPGQTQNARRVIAALAAVSGIATLGLAGLAVVHLRETPPVERPLTLSIPMGEQDRPVHLALSPDGRQLAVVVGPSDVHELNLRSLESGELQTLPGTRGARFPFWSPDSRSIAFFADDALKIIPAAGGPVETLCRNTGKGMGGTWSRQGVLLFGSESGSEPLRRADASGGECRAVGEVRAFQAAFLPDGEHFFYGSADRARPGAYLATLTDPAGRKVLADNSDVAYAPAVVAGAPAHLLFLRGDRLMAQRFDATTLRVEADPFVVAAPASRTPSPPASVSSDGTLAYLAGGEPASRLAWFDRNGKAVGDVGPPAGVIWNGVLSPDAGRMLFVRAAEAEPAAAWLYDLARGSTDRLSPVAQSVGNALWSSDGSRIWMSLASPDKYGWYQKDLRSGAITELVALDPSIRRTLSDWSRDGRYLVYTEVDPKTGPDIWWAPVEAGTPNMKAAVKFLGTAARESYGQLSPDGRFLAYTSDESGSYEVHVRSFPSGATDWKIPGPGARSPRWRADGRELFFIDYQPPNLGTLMAVSVALDGPDGLRLGVPRALFSRVALPGSAPENNDFLFSPHPDGQRFLVNALTGDGLPRITVITHWQQAVARRTQGTSR